MPHLPDSLTGDDLRAVVNDYSDRETRAAIRLAAEWLDSPDDAPGDDDAIPGLPTPARLARYATQSNRATIIMTALAYIRRAEGQ